MNNQKRRAIATRGRNSIPDTTRPLELRLWGGATTTRPTDGSS